MNVLGRSGTLAGVGTRDAAGAVLARRRGVVDVGVPGAGFRIYDNHGAGVVDFARAAGRVSTNARRWRKSGLSFPGTWRFVVRAYNAAGTEMNVERMGTVRIGTDGELAPVRPTSPAGTTARTRSGGRVAVTWRYERKEGSAPAAGFHIYHDDGTGSMGPTPAGEMEAREGTRDYEWLSETLTSGKCYRFMVKSATATGVESEGEETAEAEVKEFCEQPREIAARVVH